MEFLKALGITLLGTVVLNLVLFLVVWCSSGMSCSMSDRRDE